MIKIVPTALASFPFNFYLHSNSKIEQKVLGILKFNQFKEDNMNKWIKSLIFSGIVLTTSVFGQQVYTVNSADDADDGSCNSKHCSLREAIGEAETSGDIIAFDIQPAGEHDIKLQSALPGISEGVFIDGYSQQGATPASGSSPAIIMITIDGTLIPGNADGLVVTNDAVTISGLTISNFSGSGIHISSNNNVITGNYIGTDREGEADQGNTQHGILLSNANGNTIGGSSPADRNVISGNDDSGITMRSSDFNAISGNYIGVNAAGDEALRNSGEGINISQGSSENIIGGDRFLGAGNVISGNQTSGIFIDDASQTQVMGNFIGVDFTGSMAISNGSDGISVDGANTLLIGQNINQGTGNVISGNNGDGIDASSVLNLEISGNWIGTDVTGTLAIGNERNGIQLLFAIEGGALIGGVSSGMGNIISNNGTHGIFLLSGSSRIYGNKIGTDVTGTIAMGNSVDGIHNEASSVDIGGRTTTNKPNIIAANGFLGLHIQAGEDCIVRGNSIGTDFTGTLDLGNADNGIKVESDWNRFGGTNSRAGNTVAFNRRDGIRVDGGNHNRIMSNNIFKNSNAGIELLPIVGITPNDPFDVDTGSNDEQNFPVILGVTNSGGTVTVNARLRSQPFKNYRIEFFVGSGVLKFPPPPYNKGGNFAGALNVTTNSNGVVDFTRQITGGFGQFVTATATDLTESNTSEFSARFTIPRGTAKTSKSDLDENESIPESFQLSQNYPNPFNPSTTIRFALPDGPAVQTSLKIYSMRGQLVRTLVDQYRSAGFYNEIWDGKNEFGVSVASGVYQYVLKAGTFQQAQRMILLK